MTWCCEVSYGPAAPSHSQEAGSSCTSRFSVESFQRAAAVPSDRYRRAAPFDMYPRRDDLLAQRLKHTAPINQYLILGTASLPL